MEDKTFPEDSSDSSAAADRGSPERTLDRFSARIDKILNEIEYLLELEEEFLRRQYEPFRLHFSDSSRRR